MVLVVNHVPRFSYDGMGNMTNDGSTVYTYDAEGRPTQYQFVVGSSPQTVEGRPDVEPERHAEDSCHHRPADSCERTDVYLWLR
jgi:hypothetical protein